MAEYKFKTLESKYDGFLGPAFEVTVGSMKIDSSKIPISSLSVDIDAGQSAGGCSFVIESQFDYEKSKWANNLLEAIAVGAKIIIQGGYVKKEQVFHGFVDQFSVTYSAGGSPSISVNGIDAKGYLMNASDQKYLIEKPTATVVKEIFNDCVSAGYATKVTVGSITDFNAQLIQDEIDDYKFLCFLAEMYNMNFFVVNGELIFDNLMSKTKPVLTLTLGVSLLSFSKSMSLRNQVGKVVVYGLDPKTKEAIKGEATSTSVGGAGKLASAIASGYKGTVEKEVSLFATTPEECKNLAQARFDARAFEFVSGRGRCLGIPEVIPGRYIKIEGVDNKSADIYFITKVTHEYSSDQGYFTRFDVKGAKSK